jgi:hypothetical protein
MLNESSDKGQGMTYRETQKRKGYNMACKFLLDLGPWFFAALGFALVGGVTTLTPACFSSCIL